MTSRRSSGRRPTTPQTSQTAQGATSRLDSTGIRPHTEPATYRGIALMVVRDAMGYPLVAFDGNGATYFLNHGTYLEAVDVPFPITDADVREAIQRDQDDQ